MNPFILLAVMVTGLAFLCFTPVAAVKGYLQNVTFEDGSKATGSYGVHYVDITSGAAEYGGILGLDEMFVFAVSDSSLLDLTGQPCLLLIFVSDLLSNGTVDIDLERSHEGTCADRTCRIPNVNIARQVVSGYVTTDRPPREMPSALPSTFPTTTMPTAVAKSSKGSSSTSRSNTMSSKKKKSKSSSSSRLL